MTTDNSPAYPQDENIFIPFSSWVHQNTLPSVVGEEHMRRPCTATGAGALFSQRGVTHPWRRYNAPTGAYRASPVSWSIMLTRDNWDLVRYYPNSQGGGACCITLVCSRARPRMTRTGSRQRPRGNARSGASWPATASILGRRSAALGQAGPGATARLSPHSADRASNARTE